MILIFVKHRYQILRIQVSLVLQNHHSEKPNAQSGNTVTLVNVFGNSSLETAVSKSVPVNFSALCEPYKKTCHHKTAMLNFFLHFICNKNLYSPASSSDLMPNSLWLVVKIKTTLRELRFSHSDWRRQSQKLHCSVTKLWQLYAQNSMIVQRGSGEGHSGRSLILTPV